MRAVRKVNRKAESGGFRGGTLGTSAGTKFEPRSEVTSTAFEICGVTVHFPFKPYDVQLKYMKTVISALNLSENALLESPTGTGKTLCLLCATIAWQRSKSALTAQSAEAIVAGTLSQSQRLSQNSQGTKTTGEAATSMENQAKSRSTPTIIYASRTHSQLSQVVRELKNTRYRPRHAVLGSRDQMCINPKVKKRNGESTSSEINHDCNKLVKDRRCSFKTKLEGFNPKTTAPGTQPVLDMEDLLDMGTKNKVCPFYYTRSYVDGAELILVPYNYLFDKDARKTTLADVPWTNSIIIFDEAHNLESFASESASFDLTSTDISGCIREVERGLGYIQMNPEFESRAKPENVIRLKALFMKLEEYILVLPNDRSAYPGEYMMDIFQEGSLINHANYELFSSEVRNLTEIFLDVQGGSGSKGAPRLEHFLQCLKRVFGETTEARCIAKSKSYRVHVSPKPNMEPNGAVQKGRTVSYWCFAPSEAMRELADLKVRSILVTSGTLSPLESYALELDIPFPHRLENPHVIPDDQIHVQVVGKGVSGKLLTSTYSRRQDDDYYAELGSTLVTLSRVTPGGMLIFFPSYSMMETCVEKWGGPSGRKSYSKQSANNFFAARRKKNANAQSRYSFPRVATSMGVSNTPASPWKRLLDRKAIVLEPKTSSDLPDAISEFRRYLGQQRSTGCFLFGVCRGKISEGIDFANDMCRAVVITGLPFAPYKDPKVQMKREFLDTNRNQGNIKSPDKGGFDQKTGRSYLSGHEWYTQGAHRAVNQAVGRVIRNITDYGAVLLLDSRFSQPSQIDGLSKWVRPHIRQDQGMGAAVGGLVKFFKNAEAKYKKSQGIEAPVPPPKNDVRILLQYENDEQKGKLRVVEEPTTIAIINRDTSAKEGSGYDGDGAGRSFIAPGEIVKRVNLKDQIRSQSSSTKMKSISKNLFASLPGGNLEDLYDKKRAAIPPMPVTQNHSNSKPAPVTQTKQSAPNNKQIITKFFGMVRDKLSTSEQSIIKKSLVAMHVNTSKDRSKFLRAAAELIQVLCEHEPLESKSETGGGMIGLLFEVLPQEHRADVQKMAVHQCIIVSDFGKLCKQSLDEEDHKRCFADVNAALLNVWYGDESKRMSSKEVLDCARKLYKCFTRVDESLAITLLRHFSRLLPVKYSMMCNSLADNTKALGGANQVKKVEKNSMGENSIRVRRFRPNALMYAQENDDIAAASIGDVLRENMDIPAEKSPVKETHVDSQAKKRPGNGGDGSSKFRKMIEDVESYTFIGKRDPPKRRSIESNAPKNLVCSICSRSYDKPYIASCGHMLCLQCWNEWLRKSKSCPVCRAKTNFEEIAQVVFKEPKK